MILRKAISIEEGDVIKIKFDRYKEQIFEVESIGHVTGRAGTIPMKLKNVDLDFGPTVAFLPEDLLEIILS